MHVTPTTLEGLLKAEFPTNATCWSKATDEVRDMSRAARQTLELSELHAVRFDKCTTPAEWNTHGIASIVRWYKQMDDTQQEQFCDQFAHWINEWMETT